MYKLFLAKEFDHVYRLHSSIQPDRFGPTPRSERGFYPFGNQAAIGLTSDSISASASSFARRNS